MRKLINNSPKSYWNRKERHLERHIVRTDKSWTVSWLMRSWSVQSGKEQLEQSRWRALFNIINKIEYKTSTNSVLSRLADGAVNEVVRGIKTRQPPVHYMIQNGSFHFLNVTGFNRRRFKDYLSNVTWELLSLSGDLFTFKTIDSVSGSTGT